MIVVVTGFSPAGYELYGKQFIDRFNRYWPPSVGLLVYSEDPIPMERGASISRWLPNGIREFIDKNKGVPLHCGTQPRGGWQEKDNKLGYCYRFDAVKFCWQMFYPEHAASTLRDDDILVWLDGDVMTTNDVSISFIQGSLDNADIVHLGRKNQASELGFWGVRLNQATRKFLFDLAETYRSGEVFRLPQYHSGFVFDHCLQSFRGKTNNLTKEFSGNVWHHTPLEGFSVHLKGRLKGEVPGAHSPGG